MFNILGRQSWFEKFFFGQRYAPDDAIDPYPWQTDCHLQYEMSCLAFRKGVPLGTASLHDLCGAGVGEDQDGRVLGGLAPEPEVFLDDRRGGPHQEHPQGGPEGFQAVVRDPSRHLPFQEVSRRDPQGRDGYILTYAHLINNPDFHRGICGPDTLVFFDEVHHLGDGDGWGKAAIDAFGHVNHVICLSGTPWRSDKIQIPFVEYDRTEGSEILRFRANGDVGFSYPWERAIADEICRKPIFVFRGGDGLTIRITPGNRQGFKTVTFDDIKINDRDSAERLLVVRSVTGSIPRKEMLRDALAECREQGARSSSSWGAILPAASVPTEDATELLPAELRELGYDENDWDVVWGDDQKSQQKIDDFGKSDKWILISINMVSEGTDIPQISAAIFLTVVTAKLSVWQRIGRRWPRWTRSREALSSVFADPTYMKIADEILHGIEKILAEEGRLKKSDNGQEGNGGGERPKTRSESIGVADDGVGVFIQYHDSRFTGVEWQAAKKKLRDRDLPCSDFAVGLFLTVKEAM